MRHSKAGQTNKKIIDDHERQLTKMGEAICPKAAAYFKNFYKDNPPEIIISSTATRAKQTANMFRRSFSNPDIEIKTVQKLYLGRLSDILDVIKELPDKYRSILVVGHNPGLQDFCVDFAHEGDKEKFRQMRSNFPPCSFATFNIEKSKWSETKADSGVLVDFVNGKKLK
jgi:phosphohistidine phosphatase